MILRVAAFMLPDEADLRAILFTLADMNTGCGVTTQIERFTNGNVLWVQVEGFEEPETMDTLDEVKKLMPLFGLTYTEV